MKRLDVRLLSGDGELASLILDKGEDNDTNKTYSDDILIVA